MRNRAILLMAALAFAASAQAQQATSDTVAHKEMTKKVQHERAYTTMHQAADGEGTQVLDKIKVEFKAGVAIEARVTKNAPYSGEATTESIQLLPDGNRIVQRSTTRVYRDSAGRTRRETLDADGQAGTIAISDPTTGDTFVVSPKMKKVVRSVAKYTVSGEPEHATAEAITVPHDPEKTMVVMYDQKVKAEKERTQAEFMIQEQGGNPALLTIAHDTPGETTKEDLGQQSIEGLTATGTRRTTVIPAGAIGNEQPIKVVSEEWFSPELQVLVLTKHSDPRTGETTYRLSNIARGEQPRNLFDPPVPPPPPPPPPPPIK